MSKVARICEATQQRGNALVLLILLKTWDGSELPTHYELAKLANISPRQAERDLQKLIDDGEAERVAPEVKGRGHVTRFRLKESTSHVSDKSTSDVTDFKAQQISPSHPSDIPETTSHLTDLSDVNPVTSDAIPAANYVTSDGTKVAPYSDIRTSTDNSQPTVGAGADAPPPPKGRRAKKAKLPPDPRREHEAIKLVKTLMERWPAKFLWDDLIELLGDEPDELRLTRCRKLWLKQTFNPNSTGWTDWYPAGVLEAKEAEYGRNGRPQAGGAGNQQNGGSGGTRRERNLAELRRQSEEVTFDWTPSAVDDPGPSHKARGR